MFQRVPCAPHTDFREAPTEGLRKTARTCPQSHGSGVIQINEVKVGDEAGPGISSKRH